MVSHAEVAESSRRASSVSSRTNRSRHHHRGRSHHGGASYIPQNEFPFFAQTGDVEIIIASDGQEKRYLLHRLILAQFSGFFEAGTSEEWSRSDALRNVQQAATSRPEQALAIIGEEPGPSQAPVLTPGQINQNSVVGRRWRYELDWENVEEDEEPMLVQKTPSASDLFASTFIQQPAPPRTRPKPTSTSFFRSMASLTLSHQVEASQSTAQILPLADPTLSNRLLRDYDNLFRTFYNFTPNLNSTNIACAYSECKALLALADMYDALPVVGPRIDHHLLRFSSRLFKQIAKYPPSYLKLGYLARSRIIFSEALTHVVGQWPAALPYLKPPDYAGGGYDVPQSVIDLIEDKVDELEELKIKTEAKLFRLTLTTSRGERVNPSNDYLGWLAISLWRQWLAENTTPEVRGILKNGPNGQPSSRPGSGGGNNPRNHAQPPAQNNNLHQQLIHPPPVNTGRIYRLIASTNSQCYLSHEEIKRFLKLHPISGHSSSTLYSRDNLRRFERKIDEIKNVARDMVKPLTRNCLELDLRSLMMGDGQNNSTGPGGLGYLTCMRVEEGDLPW